MASRSGVALLLHLALLAVGTAAAASSEPEAVVQARLALIRNDRAQAEKESFQLRTLSLKNPARRNLLAQVLTAAAKKLGRTAASNKDGERIWLELGQLYMRSEDWGKAEDAIMKAQTANPESVEAKYLLGKFYLVVSSNHWPQTRRRPACVLASAS
jgi:cytochrome c-type biogenesis protein CcmH/NrfG